MGLLEGKRALVFGLANDHSIAWGIARALHREGATVGFSSVEMLIEKRVRPLAEQLGATFVEPCDVQSDEDIERVFARWKDAYGRLDILIHAVAFANKDELSGEFIRTSREGFRLAHDVSAYSLVALAREARPLMSEGGADPDALLLRRREGGHQLQRHGRGQGVPGGLRALPGRGPRQGGHPGQRHQRRARCARWRPRACPASRRCTASSTRSHPLRRPLSIDDLGNAAVYLCSDMSRGTTGEIHYVDGGYNIIGVPEVVD